MHPHGNFRRSNRWALLCRLVACLSLVLIISDLAEGSCDPLPLGDSTVLFASAGGPGEHDPCADFCVPDCYCCASTSPALPAYSLPENAAFSRGPASGSYRVSAGVSPLPEHVPLPSR